MSTSFAATSPPDFWSAISRLGASGAPRLAWEIHAGSDFPLLAPFLSPTNGPICRTVPCPTCSGPRAISLLPDGSYLMEAGEYCSGCVDPITVTQEQVTPTALSLGLFARAAAAALRFQPEGSALSARVAPLGTLIRNATPIPVGLVLLRDLSHDAMDHALMHFPAPAVLILPLPTAVLVSELRARRYWVFTAATLLQPKPKGAFRTAKPLAALLADMDGGAPLRPIRDPLPLRGQRYEIAQGFVAITKLGRKPVRYEITQPKARALLRALVEAGAGSEDTGIHNRALLGMVYGGEVIPDVRPSQLLRFTGPQGTKPLPFRDDILHHNRAGGLYWLEL